MNNTREEILERTSKSYGWNDVEQCMQEGDYDCIKAAMSEYAEQEAVSFAEWITKSGYDFSATNEWYKVYGPAEEDEIFTTNQLYQIYKKEVKQ